MTKVELFEAIRRDRYGQQKSVREIARDRGIHRRTVRQALESAVPPARKRVEREAPVLTAAMCQLIDAWLEGDREAPRKQRHTARRIWQRLRSEQDFRGAESTVRRFVGRRRRELGAGRKDVTIILVHEPGAEAEVDWYEAAVDFPGGRQTVQVFAMRACYSGREFHMAFPRATQRAFLEAHVAAFEYFGGVFPTIRYDNLKSAAKKVLRGRRREETDRFVALRSHYLFAAQFCTPGIEGAHEKGGVEGGLGRLRRNHLVPVPQLTDFDALNRLLLDACAQDDLRRIEGHARTIQEDWADEKPRLQTLPERFATAHIDTAEVDGKATIRVRTNRYSVPVRLADRRVEYRLHARRIEIWHDGQKVAAHERLQGRNEVRLDLDHYLELLWRKPGALVRSLALRQARQRGRWPADYDRLHEALLARFSASEAARQMLTVLMLHREAGADDVHTAVGLAVEHGAHDASAVEVILRQLQAGDAVVEPLDQLGVLAGFDRPMLGTDDYDQLLTLARTGSDH
jgi:transposase